MSSINKSGTRFTPKITQRKRPLLPTPVSTQKVQSQPQSLLRSETDSVGQTSQNEQGNDAILSPNSQILVTPTETHDQSALSQKQSQGHVSTSSSSDEENEDKLSDVEELKESNQLTVSNNNTNSIGTSTQKTVLNESNQPPNETRSSTLIKPSSTNISKGRLNSLSTSNTDNNNNISNTTTPSRRPSIINNNGNSRRNSASISISRKTSMSGNNMRPILFGPVLGNKSGRGSVAASGDSDDESQKEKVREAFKIPVQDMKRRRSSAAGRKRRRSNANSNVNDDGFKEPLLSRQTFQKGIIEEEENKEDSERIYEDSKGNNGSNVMLKEEIKISELERQQKSKFLYDIEKEKIIKVKINEENNELSFDKEKFNPTFKISSLNQVSGIKSYENYKLLEDIEIDQDTMSLGDLCKPSLPFGKVSKNFELAQEADKRKVEQVLLRKKRRELARKLRIPEKAVEVMNNNGESFKFNDEETDIKERNKKIKEMLEQEENDNTNDELRNVPLLQMNENGEVILDQESRVIDRHDKNKQDTNIEKIEENPFENIITSTTYSKRRPTIKWTPQEVAELLKAVSIWGTDFGLIAQLFPYRTRKQIKAKFLLEEKKHPHLVEFALLNKSSVDIEEYSGKAGKEFKDLEEYNEELRKLKEKHDKELKEMDAARERARLEDINSAKGSNMAKANGRSRKAVLIEFRKNEEVVGTIDDKRDN